MGKKVSLAEELKPIMFFARLMGAAPYTIKDNIYKISPCAFVYTIILNVANLIFTLLWIREISNGPYTIKIKGLSSVPAIISLSCIILNTFYTFLHRRETGELCKNVNKFDAAINLRPATTKSFAIIWAIMLSSISISGMYLITDFYGSGRIRIGVVNSLVLFGRNTASMGFFLTVLRSMLRRFQELNRMIERDSKDLDMNDIVLRRSMGLRKVWILYDQLMEATENLNSLYTAELLFWILTSFFNLLRRFHAQWNEYELNPISILANGLPIILYVARLLLLAWFCDKTASMANNVAAEAFRVNSRVLQMNRSWDDEDTFVIGQYFLLRRSFKITAGGGFLHVNLPLLRTIVATILTYLVILRSPGEKRQGARMNVTDTIVK